MPITLNVPDWGEVQALSIREVAKRLNVHAYEVEDWIRYDLVEAYDGKKESYIDLIDIAGLEKLSKQFPREAPWDRILWFRYEVRQRRMQEQCPDPRAVDRTMVQPQPTQRPHRPEPKQPRRGTLPKDLREIDDRELLATLEAREPTRPPQAQPLRQAIPPAAHPCGKYTIEVDDYYAATTVKDTSQQYPKQRKRIF